MSESTQSKVKSFWTKPEGITGWLMIAGMAFVGIYFWGSIVPFIESMLESTLKVGIMLGISAGVIGIVSDAKMRAALGAVFKGVARLITNFVITIDPLGILKDHISKLKKYLDEINDQLGIINGQAKSLQLAIENNNKAMQHNMELVQAAKARNDVPKAQLAISDINRKKASNEEYMKLLNKINTIYQFMCKMRDNSDYILQDTIAQVDEEERKYKTINAAANALSKVKKFFTNDDELYNDTLSALEENFTQKLGAIDDFMIRSKGVLDNMDLNNDSNLIKGIELFNQWEKDNSAFFDADAPKQINTDSFTQLPKATNFNFDIGNIDSASVEGISTKKSKFLD